MAFTKQRIIVRTGTDVEWAANPNEVLAKGEIGYDSTNDYIKIGDGISVWSDLPTAASWAGSATLDNVTDTATRAAVRPADAAALAATNVTAYVNQATTASNGLVQLVDDGTNNAHVVQDHDSRLTDAREPTAHTHEYADLSGVEASGAATTAVANHAALEVGVHGITNENAFDAVNRMSWNNTDKTIEFPVTDDVTIQIGQEQMFLASNKTGSDITNGQVVYVSGEQGQRPSISLAKADASATSIGTIGLATEDIADNGTGMVTTFGIVRGVPIVDLAAGDEVYLSAATAGAYTGTKPDKPNHIVRLGTCINTTGGSSADIFVSVHAVQDFSDVGEIWLGTGEEAPTNGQVLTFDGTIWENADNPATAHAANLTSAHGLVIADVATKPTASSGQGEWKSVASTTGGALKTPANGTKWAYFIICMKTDGTLNLTTPIASGVANADTEIGAATASHKWVGMVYRAT